MTFPLTYLLFWLCFIETEFTYHKTDPFTVDHSVAFSPFTVLCNHSLHRVPKHSLAPKGKPASTQQSSPPLGSQSLLISPPSSPCSNHGSAFSVSGDLLVLDLHLSLYFKKMYLIVAFVSFLSFIELVCFSGPHAMPAPLERIQRWQCWEPMCQVVERRHPQDRTQLCSAYSARRGDWPTKIFLKV